MLFGSIASTNNHAASNKVILMYSFIYRKNKIKIGAFVGITLVLCEWFFFRNVISADALFGDRGDGRLTMLLAEHWWNYFSGKEKFSELAMFYPCEGVLGYSDLLLGYGVIHSFLRMIGMSIFHSYKTTMIIVHLFGVVSMYFLMRYKIKCNELWSLFGTIAFCYSNAYAVHIGHTQLNAISFLPLLLILVLGFLDNFENRWKRNVYGYGTVIWFVLLTYNSWYVACFSGFFVLLFFVVYFIGMKRAGCDLRSLWRDCLFYVWKDLLGYILVMAVLFIPFIKVYVPVLKGNGGYIYEGVIQYMPELIDVMNVSSSNFMLGWWITLMKLPERGYSGEVEIGFSIILLVCFVAGFIKYKNQYKTEYEDRRQDAQEQMKKEIAIISICAATMTGIVLPIRVNANGVSLWWFVYTFIPVMKSIRAVSRFFLWLSFPMSVITAYLMNKLLNISNRKMIIISLFIVVMLAVSNINVLSVRSGWNASEERDFIHSIAAPPSDVESFYIVDSAKDSYHSVLYQLDAFEIANHYGIKTINGYSGNAPSDWTGVRDPNGEQYQSGVYSWIKTNDLKHVYAYDRSENTWTPYEKRLKESSIIDEVFCPEMDTFSLSSGLKDWVKGEFVWTSQDFETTICNAKIKDTGLIILMQTSLSRYMRQNPDLKPELSVYVDGQFAQKVEVTDEKTRIVIPMSDHETDLYTVSIRTNCYFVPKDIGENEDARSLSVALYYIGD